MSAAAFMDRCGGELYFNSEASGILPRASRELAKRRDFLLLAAACGGGGERGCLFEAT
jgi:hypothetical protein